MGLVGIFLVSIDDVFSQTEPVPTEEIIIQIDPDSLPVSFGVDTVPGIGQIVSIHVTNAKSGVVFIDITQSNGDLVGHIEMVSTSDGEVSYPWPVPDGVSGVLTVKAFQDIPQTEPRPDTIPPVIVTPNDHAVEATSSNGSVVTFTVSATDDVDGIVSVGCSHNSGETLPIGITTVTCSANDASGNTVTKSFTITVTELESTPQPEPPFLVDDQIPPELLMPADMIITGNDPDGTVITYSVKAIDNFDQILIPTCDPSSGSTFPLGITVVRCTVTDSSGNTDKDSFKVLVEFSEFIIPEWVKGVASFWCNDEIDDPSFIQAIQYLITSKVIIIQTTESEDENESGEIPSWIKNTACWWSQGLITDGDFVNGIQFLIENGIIQV